LIVIVLVLVAHKASSFQLMMDACRPATFILAGERLQTFDADSDVDSGVDSDSDY